MKQFVFFIVTILSLNSLYSQDLRDPGTNNTTSFTTILSDYGPRNFTGQGTASVFHPGIDYNIVQPSYAYEIEGGTLTLFGSLNNDLAFIVVGNWKYQHILVGRTSDYHWELREDFDNEGPVIFIRSGVKGVNLTTNSIYISSSRTVTSIKDPETNQTLIGETFIPQGTSIFIPRPSGYNGYALGNHLHLQRNANSNLNPLEFVVHQDAAVANITVTPAFKRINNGTATPFTDGIIYGNPVIIEADVNSQTDKDFDNLAISTSKDNGVTFQNLNTWHYTGAQRIQANQVVRLNTVQAINNAVTQGVYPVLDLVSREFFKYRWNTQQLKAGETVISSSSVAYPDGQYIVRHIAEDVTHHQTTEDNTVTLDNFRPYIRKVEIRRNTANGDELYTGEWRWSGTALTLSQQSPRSATENDDIW
ncbi:MAG: hypothetical protein EHM93_19635, partial [Bacteroidales bacterium]